MNSIRTRLILSHVGLVALAMAVAGLYILSQMEQFYLDGLISGLEEQASVTASYLRSEVLLNRPDLLQPALRDLQRRNTLRVQVVDVQGRLAGSSSPEDDGALGQPLEGADIPEALAGQRTTLITDGVTGLHELASVTAPITSGGRVIGAVRLTFRLTDVQREIAMLHRDLALGLLAAGAACAAFAALLGGSLAAPLQKLAAAAHALARGDLRRRVGLSGNDEVAMLGAAFDSLGESLETLELARREVMSEVSHDLHSMATGLSTAVEALQRGALDDPELAPLLLQGIATRTRQISRLADDLLQTSRFEMGRLVLERRPTDPTDVVEQAAAEFVQQAAEQQVTLRVAADGPLAEAMLDSERLLQALANLIENALRHTSPGGIIELTVRQEGGALLFAVMNDGPRIPREEAARMFGRFYRPTGGRPGRLGLGLGIVSGIAEAHGGHVAVESTDERGTSFTLVIPIVPVPAPPPHAETAGAYVASLRSSD